MLSPDGQSLEYSTFLGGVESDGGAGIAIDPAGDVYVSGWTRSSDFPTTPGAADTTLGGVLDASITKFDEAPSNEFGFGKLKRNRKKGTAKLTVKLPGPGGLALAKTKKVRGAAKVAEAAGPMRLELASHGKAKRKLRRSGAVKVKAEVTFTPTDGFAGTSAKKVRLIRNPSE